MVNANGIGKRVVLSLAGLCRHGIIEDSQWASAKARCDDGASCFQVRGVETNADLQNILVSAEYLTDLFVSGQDAAWILVGSGICRTRTCTQLPGNGVGLVQDVSVLGIFLERQEEFGFLLEPVILGRNDLHCQ